MAHHLTLEEREFLYRLNKKGKSKTEIAELMGRDRSTVYRELKRNSGRRGYRPKQAQRLAEERRFACRRPRKMDEPDVYRYVQERIRKRNCSRDSQLSRCPLEPHGSGPTTMVILNRGISLVKRPLPQEFARISVFSGCAIDLDRAAKDAYFPAL